MEASAKVSGRTLIFAQHLVHLSTQATGDGCREANSGQVAFDSLLDAVYRQVRQLTVPSLPASAEEVEVVAAVALGVGDDHLAAAAVAPEQTLEPVVMPTLTDVTAVMQHQHFLVALVGGLSDERLVPAGVLDDVVDVLLLLDPGDHLLEGRALVDAGGGAPRLNELADNLGVQRFCLSGASFPLCGDRDTLRVVVGGQPGWGQRYIVTQK